VAHRQESALEPLNHAVSRVRGPSAGRLIVEYGDYESPYSCEDDNLRLYAAESQLDVALFDSDWGSTRVLGRVRRDAETGTASGEVRETPTLFIDGVVHRSSYDAATLLEALAR
jgi:hypothetical protein